MANGDSPVEGLYETLLTRAVAGMLERTVLEASSNSIDAADQSDALATHVRNAVRRALDAERDVDKRRALVNEILENLGAPEDALDGSPRYLASLSAPPIPGRVAMDLVRRPATPLSQAALLTNSHDEPALGHELRAELASADSVDLLCAFVKWHGVRLLEEQLLELRRRGVPFRVITTTYMGATERAALDRLVRDFGAEVRVHYDAQRTRLHAKAWLFERATGFDTAYVGSSNLSRAALLDGVEWNVRLSSVATPPLIQKFRATFDTYWNDPSFEPYDPDTDRDRLDDALAEASGARGRDRVTLTLSGLQVRPYPYQSHILEQLDVERQVHDRHRNLVVAATGTGKTVIAALDYRRLAEATTARPRLLFVAHRREILTQSLRTYREVLGDPNFGELYVGGTRPERWEHVFASIQSLTAYGIGNIPADAFEIVVIDEFHHAQARTYRQILEHLTPAELLGMTATPERGDGIDVRDFFGGRTAAELRLWDALGADLLTPFHYFGVADGTDLRGVDWRAGAYDIAALSNLYTSNDIRARIILGAVRDKIVDIQSMKALGFCVSVDHANYMTRVFNQAGIPSAVITGSTASASREASIEDLRHGRIKAIFAVDVFNEGVDVPSINTVLFMRPTESSTVFLQQLGRGLRTAPGKAVLTALDFVGHHRKEFRFDLRYRALTGSTRSQLIRDVEAGFPFLPAGSQILLDRQTQATVLEHIRRQVSSSRKQLATELKAHPTTSLSKFLEQSGAHLADVIRDGRSWTELRRLAGLTAPVGGAAEVALLKRVRALAHVNDPERAAAYLRWLAQDAPSYGSADTRAQAYARMLFFSLWPDGGGHDSYDSGLASLRSERSAV
ncbi:MAG: DEAD/DEAH box helicase family protein, partial [Dermatophilaceae bacterium]